MLESVLFCWNLSASPVFGVAAKSLQLCPTLCDPIDGSPPGSAANPGILLARVLEWVATVFSLNLATVSKFYTIVLLQLNNLSNFLNKIKHLT